MLHISTIIHSFLIEDGDAFEDSFGGQLQHVQVVVPPGDGVVLGQHVLGQVEVAAEDDWGKLAVLDAQAGVHSSQLDEGVVLGAEEVEVGTQLAIG